MKNFLIFLIIFSFYFTMTAQNNDDLIAYLYSENLFESLPATRAIIDERIEEAEDDILLLYDEKPPVLQKQFLIALNLFNYTGTKQLALDFIQNIDTYPEDQLFIDPLEAKVDVTYLLLQMKEYSTSNYVFELINRDGIHNISSSAFHSLSYIMENIPQEELQAKDIFLSILTNSPDEYKRYHSLSYLADKYGSDLIDNYINSFINDEGDAVRMIALEYLMEFNFINMQTVLRERLILDNSHPVRCTIADTLLQVYGTPADFKAVIDYQQDEPNATAKAYLSFNLDSFIPPEPDESISVSVMIQNLISYIDDLISYDWIHSNVSYDFSRAVLGVEDNFNRGNYDEAINVLNEIISNALITYNNNMITIEGFKFLNYYSIYIRDRIEEGTY